MSQRVVQLMLFQLIKCHSSVQAEIPGSSRQRLEQQLGRRRVLSGPIVPPRQTSQELRRQPRVLKRQASRLAVVGRHEVQTGVFDANLHLGSALLEAYLGMPFAKFLRTRTCRRERVG